MLLGVDLEKSNERGELVYRDVVQSPELNETYGPAAVAASPELSATSVAFDGGPRPHFLNSYDEFFTLGGFVTGQANVATTTPGAASGATTLPVASATGIVVNTVLVVNPGAANASQHKVTAIVGTDLTITPALPATAPAASAVVSLWSSAGHLTTTGGYQLYWRWVLTRTDTKGAAIIAPKTGDKIVLLANSWGEQSSVVFGQVVTALFPTAVSVNVGVGGNTSAMLLARFDADVPSDADYVIFNEPGVNDADGVTSAATAAANVDAIIAKARALGAVPIYTGPVKYTGGSIGAQVSVQQNARAKAQAGQWDAKGPGATVADALAAILTSAKIALNSVAFGNRAQEQATGIDNSAFGDRAQFNLTSGVGNTAIGSSAQRAMTTGAQNTSVGAYAHDGLTTGTNNVAVGHYAQAALTTGGQNVSAGQRALRQLTTASNDTALGHESGAALTTGQNNAYLGSGAGYAPNNVTANATTTAQGQTTIGFQSGQASATQVDYITALGYRAIAGDASATALGARANASHANAVALGADTATSGPNQVNMGQRYVEISEMGGEPANPGADKARLFAIDNGSGKTRLGVKFPSGVTTWLATEA